MKKKIRIMIAALSLAAFCMFTGCSSETDKTEAKQDTQEEVKTEAETEAETEEDTQESRIPKELTEGDEAPDFTAELTNEGTFKLSDYKDKTVILNFWATWCPPCVGEMPAFERLKADNNPNLEILCVNCAEDKQTVNDFVKENGYTFNIAYDVNYEIERFYPTDGIPYTLIIHKGVIKKIYMGAYDADTQYNEYKSAIDACQAEQ